MLRCHLEGELSSIYANLLFDTGATRSILSRKVVDLIGPSNWPTEGRYSITTASGIVQMPEVRIRHFQIVDMTLQQVRFLAHELPGTAGIDGLLGWDFFAGTKLNIDFDSGVFEWVQA